jgi:hypothetical protein
MGAPTARDGTGNRTSTGNSGTGSNRIVGNEFGNRLNGGGVGASGGIDTLTGDGRVDVDFDGDINGAVKPGDGIGADMRGNLSSDEFVVGSNYRSTTIWTPKVVERLADEVAQTPAEWIWRASESTYRDDDFVIIEDFEPAVDSINPLTGQRRADGLGGFDVLSLEGSLSEYSIGALPSSYKSSDLGSIFVRPYGAPLSEKFTGFEFGIYYTGEAQNTRDTLTGGNVAITTIGDVAPNLVAVIQSSTNLLDSDGDGVLSFDVNFNGTADAGFDLVARNYYTASSYLQVDYKDAPGTMGWGQFYELDSSAFAAFVNEPFIQNANTASLSPLIKEIV